MSLFMSRKKEGKEIEDISQKISKTMKKINSVISTMPSDMKYEEFSMMKEKLSEFSALMKKIEASNNNIKPSIFSKRTRENIEVFKLQLAELEAFAERHGIQLDEN